MSHSYAQSTELRCPYCDKEFKVGIWVIIDVSERLDLFARTHTGNLNNFTCPHCGETVSLDMPLLLYKNAPTPMTNPLLIYSPAADTNSEQNQTYSHLLLNQLRASLGSEWRNEWLLNGLLTVRRNQLPILLDGTTETQQYYSLVQDLIGLQAKNFEQAIVAYQQALTVYIKEAMPINWARTIMYLANAYTDRIQGKRAQNLEEAISCYQQALTVYIKEAMPVDWAQTMMNLAIAYYFRIYGKRKENLEEAISCYQQALTVYTKETVPIGWAQTMNNLAAAYADRIRGDRAQNIEEAIACYQQALTIRTQDTMPADWAQTMNNLAVAYTDRIRGDRAKNIEEAISCYQHALTVYTKETMPIGWAQTMMNLGRAYAEHPLGDYEQNIEEAISCYQQALTVYTREDIPIEWAKTVMNLGRAYAEHPLGDYKQNIEEAISCYQQALTVYTREAIPIEWARTMMNLAAAYKNRIRGNQAQNIEEAIACYQQALTIRTQDTMPADWAQTMNNLAVAYTDRIRGDRAKNIEEAISCYQQVLTVYIRDVMPIDWARTMMNLATAYTNRIRGNRTQNVEEAISCYQQALTIYTKDAMPVDWAKTMMGLGNTYSSRIRGDRAQNIEEAISCYQQALAVSTMETRPKEWARVMLNLANTYADRTRGDRAQNVEVGISCCQQALTVYTKEAMPIEWARVMHNLAVLYADRIRGDRAQNVEEAISCCQQALTVRTQGAMPVEWARTMANLANTYASRTRGECEQNLQAAIRYYEQALTVISQQTMTPAHRLIQRRLGNLLFAKQRWRIAAEAFQNALAAGELLYTTAATSEAHQAELREVGGLPMACAYALARQHENGDSVLSEAVVTIERNRARWLAESLALRSERPAAVPTALWECFTTTAAQIRQLQTEAQLPDDTLGKRTFLRLSELLTTARTELTQVIEEVRSYAPEFMPEPNFADIQSALGTTNGAEADVAVYLLATSQGGLALLFHAHDIIPVWLDAFTDATSRTLLSGWFEAYGAFLNERTDGARMHWFEQVEKVTEQLWTLVMGLIAAALQDLELSSHTKDQPPVVTLIPTGLLALLPLHAAWTEDTSTPKGRRYFLDDYAVRYAPSATALRHCHERVGDVNVEQLLALDEPKPIRGAGPLPNSAREVKAIASLFPAPTVLQHEQASRETTLEKLAAAQVAHFSCHGTNNWQNPLDSGLLLANNELLTVRDFLELHLPGARLATLSACETGIVGTDLPDEVIMLPSALVQAGYAGVVASLWSVADVSTAMLMVRFYQYWREEGLEPVYALRAAQRWVRDTTNGEKAQYFGQFVEGLGLRMADTVAAEFFSAAMLAEEGLEARSFAHPFWWGAFYLTGV